MAGRIPFFVHDALECSRLRPAVLPARGPSAATPGPLHDCQQASKGDTLTARNSAPSRSALLCILPPKKILSHAKRWNLETETLIFSKVSSRIRLGTVPMQPKANNRYRHVQ